MKNLEKFGVQELDAKEVVSIDGGYTIDTTKHIGGHTYTRSMHYSVGHHFLYVVYYMDGRVIRNNGQGINVWN